MNTMYWCGGTLRQRVSISVSNAMQKRRKNNELL